MQSAAVAIKKQKGIKMPYDVTGQLQNAQVVEIGVSGPDSASRLFLCSGQVQGSFGSPAPNIDQDALTFFVGPTLTRNQFIRATCSVGIAGFQTYAQSAGCNLQATDADWDDEGGKVMVRVDYRSLAGTINSLSYSVAILTEMGV